jgi:uncharacterized protein YqgC (DUF456 family)
MAQWFGYWTSLVGAIVDWLFSNIGTLVSTFLGAYFAFLFERRKRYSEQAEKISMRSIGHFSHSPSCGTRFGSTNAIA